MVVPMHRMKRHAATLAGRAFHIMKLSNAEPSFCRSKVSYVHRHIMQLYAHPLAHHHSTEPATPMPTTAVYRIRTDTVKRAHFMIQTESLAAPGPALATLYLPSYPLVRRPYHSVIIYKDPTRSTIKAQSVAKCPAYAVASWLGVMKGQAHTVAANGTLTAHTRATPSMGPVHTNAFHSTAPSKHFSSASG